MIVKNVDVIIEWLMANGYYENTQGNWIKDPTEPSFLKSMFKRCGKSPTEDAFWLDDWLESETYSTIRLGKNHRAHVFDHQHDKVLCGVNRFQNPPFKINVKQLTKEQMGESFFGYTERRGDINPNKFTCIKCQNKLIQLLGGENEKIEHKVPTKINSKITKIKGNPDLEVYELEFNDVKIKFTNDWRKTTLENLIHSYINKTEPLYNPDIKERITDTGSLALNGFWKAFDGLHYVMFKSKTRTTPWYVYYMAGTLVREAICKKHHLAFKTDDKIPSFIDDDEGVLVFY